MLANLMNKGLGGQIAEAQRKMEQAQADLGNKTVEVYDDYGHIRITMTGHQQVTAVVLNSEIADQLTYEDVAQLEQAILQAVNKATDQAKQMAAEELLNATANLKIPGLD